MTQRERFLTCMSFGEVDRVPLMEMGVLPETFERWHHEGLPRWVASLRHLEDHLGLDVSFNINWLPIEQEVFPPFGVVILAEDEETVTFRDEMGVVQKDRKHNKTIPQYMEFPVTCADDYDELSSRLNGADPGRYPEDFDEDLKWRRRRGEIVGVSFRSFFGFPRKVMGIDSWCLAFYDQPELVRRIIADRLEFGAELLQRVLRTRAVDFVQVWEDMAYKTASMISPALVREFMSPAYRRLASMLRDHGVSLIMADCDGRVTELLPLWLEAGIDGCHPCEIAAGSDPVLLRRRHPKCTLIGGIDKRVVAKGKDGVDCELERVRPVIEQGAYIPTIDHYVPADISYDTYRYFVDRRRALLAR